MNKFNNEMWQSALSNGLIEPTKKTPPVATSMINKSLAHEQFQDMKHDRFEVINDNSRHNKLKFSDRYRHGALRNIHFLQQE